MTTSALKVDTVTHSPRRARLIAFMTPVFVGLLWLMLLVGTALVLLQLAGVMFLSATLVNSAAAWLSPVAYWLGGLLGVWTLLLAYANGWKSND
ncbi:hypothetical protein JT358_09975 [Micrococcales bacterium 31B]|nr:hypothetical protein [Micrococcales bacterium 31B]